MINVDTLDDTAIEELLNERLAAVGLSSAIGECIEDWTKTADSIEDFRAARNNYSESGRIEYDTADLLVVRGAQTGRGQPRRDVIVVDLGSHRFVNFN